jgi:hypothetical protein
VDIVAADQHGRCALDASEPLFRIEPGDGGFGAGEPLEDDPVRLRGRARRHHGLFDEAWKLRDGAADFVLPGAKASMLSGRTRVCVTMVTAPLPLPLAAGDTSPVVRSLPLTAARPAC